MLVKHTSHTSDDRWRKRSKGRRQKDDEGKSHLADSSVYYRDLDLLRESSTQTLTTIPYENLRLASEKMCKQLNNAKNKTGERRTQLCKAGKGLMTFIDEDKDDHKTFLSGDLVSHETPLKGVDAGVSSRTIGTSLQQSGSNLKLQEQDIQERQNAPRKVKRKTRKERREKANRYFDLVIENHRQDVTLSAISMDEEWFEHLHEESQSSATTRKTGRMKQSTVDTTGHDDQVSLAVVGK